MLQRAQDRLQEMQPLVQRVLDQTRARVLGGDTHVPDKVLSLFEPHTETIRKGKIAKPNEFGKLVTIQEAEHQIMTAFEIHAGRPADVTLWTPALDRHQAIFGRAPDLAAGDRGFSSATNEQAAMDRGVRRVVLPRPGPKSPARRAHERQRWFRRGQRWRVGCEGRISVLKRRHGLRRCRYHGVDGMHRWVGFGVIADNLMNIATFYERAGHRIEKRDEMKRSVSEPAARSQTEQLASGHFFAPRCCRRGTTEAAASAGERPETSDRYNWRHDSREISRRGGRRARADGHRLAGACRAVAGVSDAPHPADGRRQAGHDGIRAVDRRWQA